MDNQHAFLQNIRRALGLPPEWQRSTREIPALFTTADTGPLLQRLRSRTALEKERLSELLQENGAALGITTHIVRNHEEAARVVIELVASKQPEFSDTKQIIHHDHPDLAALKLWQRFAREAVTVHTTFASDRQMREKTIASFIGITAPAIGVADSATLIDLTGPGRPRSTSLVPSIHIALLDRKNLVADLAEAYALLREMKPPDSLVFITGPSKTADIEAQMVHGAHGPRELHLIVHSPPPDAAEAIEAGSPAGN
jgi:L-lactate dehydrogenase complex protein LldG